MRDARCPATPLIAYSAPTLTDAPVRPLDASATTRTDPPEAVTKNVMSPLGALDGFPSTVPTTVTSSPSVASPSVAPSTDRGAGKMTLAVRLGDTRTRALYAFLLAAALVLLVQITLTTTWWALLGLAFVPPAARALTVVRSATGRDLVPALQLTGLAELAYGLGLFVGLLVGAT